MQDRQWLTLADAAVVLGTSEQHVNLLIDQHGLPAHRVDEHLKVRHGELDAWRAARAPWHTLFEAAPVALLLVDSSGHVWSANQKAERLFGYDPGALVGLKFDRLVVSGPTRQEGGLPFRGREALGVRQNGSELPVQTETSALSNDGLSFHLVAVTDLELRDREERERLRLAAIVEDSDDAIFSKSLDGIIQSWNRGAERLFGYSAAEIIGRPHTLLIPERLVEEERQIMVRIRAGERVEHFETRRRRKDGSEVDVSLRLSPLRDALGRVVGESKIARDITLHKQHEAEMARSNAELEQFAYVASHDLQEPLRMVANYTELLAERYRGRLDEKADKYIAYASDGARRMQRLVTDLLAYARVGSQGRPPEPVSSQEVAERARNALQKRLEETGGRITFAHLPRVMADEVQLQQLFVNLLGNALKFRSDAPPEVTLSAVPEGTEWCFAVKDNGIGLDMKYAERIFQMFQRLHEIGRYEGSGIGLSISKRIVERHGGRIWLESAPGKGTTVFFTFLGAP